MAVRPHFDTAGIRFDVAQPEHLLYPEEWQDAHNLLRDAFHEDLVPDHTDETGLDYLVHAGDTAFFRHSRRTPHLSFPGNSYAQPRIVRAFQDDELVGFMSLADNTSGSFIERYLKMMVPPGCELPRIFPDTVRQLAHKRYAFMREIAVAPEARHRGIAHTMIYLALENKPGVQPVTAYSWESELPAMPPLLQSLGMHMTEGDEVTAIYGPRHDPVRQQRWLGNVGRIMRSIYHLDGAPAAIEQAEATLR